MTHLVQSNYEILLKMMTNCEITIDKKQMIALSTSLANCLILINKNIYLTNFESII
jgi:hypothetical protein